MLKLLLHKDKDVRRFVKEKIENEFFTTPLLKKILERFLDDKLSMEPSTIIEYFQDENERDFVAHILITEIQDVPPEQIVSDCLKILKSVPLKEKIQKLRIKIREKETIGEDPQSELNELIVLQQELNNV